MESLADSQYCPSRGAYINSRLAIMLARLGKIRPRYKMSRKLMRQLELCTMPDTHR